MKHLKDILIEGILGDVDDIIARGDHEVILSNIFSTNIQQRRDALENLLNLIISYGAKQQKTTAKMKNSDSYFIQFWQGSEPFNPFKIKNGDATDERRFTHYISCIYVCKRSGQYGYRTSFINASDEQYGCNINDWIERWQYTRGSFKPQSKGCMLYEVPEELNSLFERIQMEARNHR
jgi:hypothetical protein